jgi:hypothetical protein
MREVAALYVQTDGCYFGLPGVDLLLSIAHSACPERKAA